MSFHLSLASLVNVAAKKHGRRMALASPFERIKWTYEHLNRAVKVAAEELEFKYAVRQGSVVLCDLPNVSANLVLQLACSRLGASFVTSKDTAATDMLASTREIRVGVSARGTWDGRYPRLDPATLTAPSKTKTKKKYELATPATASVTASHVHASFKGVEITGAEVAELGRLTASRLAMDNNDVACVSVSLSSAYGIGNACAAAFAVGATVVLPAVGGLKGSSGVTANRDRASATMMVLKAAKCTMLFADASTLADLPYVAQVSGTDEGEQLASDVGLDFRGGLLKLGHGTEFLGVDHLRYWAGAPFVVLGSAAASAAEAAASSRT